VALFFALFMFIGLGFDVFMLGMPFPVLNPDGAPGVMAYAGHRRARARAHAELPRRTDSVPYGTIASLLFACGMLLNSVFNGPGMILSSCMARPPNPLDDKEKQLVNIAEEMSIAAGLPPPQVYVVPDADPNAFATGFSPGGAKIAVTQGLLDCLSREELQAVVAHEMSHVRNYDIRLMTMIAALCGALALLSDWAGRSVRAGGGSRGKGKSGGNIVVFVLWLALVILAPVIAQLLATAVSRKREYLADATGAELTRNPLALARALEKIRAAASPTRLMNREGVAHMCISDPRGGLFDDKEGLVADILATHPPMGRRITALKMMAYAGGAS